MSQPSVLTRVKDLTQYARNLEVAQAAALLVPMRRGIAISCWAYGVGVVLLVLSPAGPGNG